MEVSFNCLVSKWLNSVLVLIMIKKIVMTADVDITI